MAIVLRLISLFLLTILLQVYGSAQIYLMPIAGVEISKFKPGYYYTWAGDFEKRDRISASPVLGIESILPISKKIGFGFNVSYCYQHRIIGDLRIPNMVGDDQDVPIGFYLSHLSLYANSYWFVNRFHFVLGVGSQTNSTRSFGSLYGISTFRKWNTLFSGSAGIAYSYNKYRVMLSYLQNNMRSVRAIDDYRQNSVLLTFSYVFETFSRLKLVKTVDCPKF